MPSASSVTRAGIRGVARLAAVQALYQQEHQRQAVEEVLEEFLSDRAEFPVVEEASPASVDREFFSALVNGVDVELSAIDALVAPRLLETWRMERLDPVVRAILRAGVFELLRLPEIPARVILNEYVEVAKAFFDEKEPTFINATLHEIAVMLRAPEMPSSPCLK